MQKTFPEEKRIDVGITRIDHENVIGDGQIGTLSFVVIDNIAGKVSGDGTEVSFTIDDITAIKSNEEPVLINGSEFTFSLISSVAEYNNHNDFVLFPNPASENLSFRINLNDPVVAIEIFDLAGKLLAIENPPAEEIITIPLGHLPNGFYTIKISTSAKTETQPLVIQK